MLKKNSKPSKENMIYSYIKGAIKLEFKSDSGRINFSTFLGSIIFAFISTLPDGILEVSKTLYSMFKLNTMYEAKINFIPLYIAVGTGLLCFVLMGLIFERQSYIKKKIEEINSSDMKK